MSEQMRIMRSKELPEELRDRIVARHRSGQGYKKKSAPLKVPKSTVASIILKSHCNLGINLDLNSAEGIQNMCATQIMTKSKSLRTGFSSQVAH